MKVTILDGDDRSLSFMGTVRELLADELKGMNAEFEFLSLGELKISPCLGCFGCWFRTPGRCVINDDAIAVAGKCINCDLLVFFTPVTFGGYSVELKKALDRCISNISPFFADVNGETHHSRRYDRAPEMAALGVMSVPDEEAERIFRALFNRNAINFYSKSPACLVVAGAPAPEQVRVLIRETLRATGVKS